MHMDNQLKQLQNDLIGKKVRLRIHNYYTVPKGATGTISNIGCVCEGDDNCSCFFYVHFDDPEYNGGSLLRADWFFFMSELDRYFEVI